MQTAAIKKLFRVLHYAALVSALGAQCVMGYEKADAVAGKVGFFKHANTDFDHYTAHPDEKQQHWMQNHFQRMLVYTPYFDAKLNWYPDAWFYIDSYAVYVGTEVAEKHPEWIMRDAKNNKLYIPWECHGKCEQFVGDFSQPDFRKYKIEEIRTALAKGYRGVWIDDVNLTWRVSDHHETHVTPIDRRTGKMMTLTDWRRYFTEFVEEIRKAFPTAEIAHNVIWYADVLEPENPLISRQIRAANYINIERAGNDSGLVAGDGPWGYETFLRYMDYVHQQGAGLILMDNGQTPDEREYGLATALLASNGSDFINSTQTEWTTPEHWWSGYELNLGRAISARYKSQGLLRRDFECGHVWLNQPGLPEQNITVDGAWQRIDGTSAKKLTLAGKQAAILLKPCQSDSTAKKTQSAR